MVRRNIAIEVSTIVPPWAIFHIKKSIIPISTEHTTTKIKIIAVFLKPFPNNMAVTLGITINRALA